MLSELFKKSLYHFISILKDTNDEETNINYIYLFTEMFSNGMNNFLKKYTQDKNNYNNYINNTIIDKINYKTINLKLDDKNEKNLLYLNDMSKDTIEYITKLCNIILNNIDINNLNIDDVDNNNIKSYNILFKFVPLYCEIKHRYFNCNGIKIKNIYDDIEIQQINQKINNIIKSINNDDKYYIFYGKSEHNFYLLIDFFKDNINNKKIDELIDIILIGYTKIKQKNN